MKISSIEAIALIDANNFYASCEQNINPHLRNRPVVILSNNDGCVIARSPEARALKIKMGVPYFKVKERLNELHKTQATADRAKKEKEDLQNLFSKLDKSYVDEFESRVTTNMEAARSALRTAIEAQDVDAQVKAQEQIATLTSDAAR